MTSVITLASFISLAERDTVEKGQVRRKTGNCLIERCFLQIASTRLSL